MVAIVSGNGFGLTNTSGGVLGQQGLFGGALHGSGKEGAYVNVFNGNLSLQDGDGFLASSGLNLALTRTYNSQAALSDASNNGWQDALLKQVKLVGTLNATDSYVQRIDADGSMSTFKYQSPNVYVSTDGAGGFQTITYAPAVGTTAAQWTWRADRTDLNGPYEIYDTAQAGYIVKAGDQSAVRLNYTYTKLTATSFQLNKVTDAAGDSLVFAYDAKANLTKVTITPSGAAAYAVSYGYDAQNRLSTVTTDLTPAVATDSLFYTTTYTYGPDVNGLPSQLIVAVAQSDGTRLDFAYDDNGRVISYATHTGATDGVGHVTSFSYDASGLTTSVTDPLRNVTTYGYDAAGQLTSVNVPGVGTTTYTYDAANGNVLSMTDARGLRTEYTYDANGNRTGQRDAAGNTVTRVYAPGTGLLLSETTYLAPSDNWTPTAPQTTRYAYDKFNRLRYAVTPEGRVTEYVYPNLTAATQVEYSAVRQYTADFYTPAGTAPLDTVALDKWNGTKTAVSQTSYTYVRGRVSQTVTLNSDSATAVSTTSYTYSPNGQLLTSVDGNGNTTTLTYDGLGRQRTKVVTNKAGTVVSSAETSYAGAGAVVTDTLYNPLTKVAFATNISTYDAAGELLSIQQSGVVGATVNAYDAEGHLRVSTSPGGQNTYWLYDAAGRQVAEIDALGALTEKVYNQDGQVIRSIRYATALTPQKMLALTARNADGSVVDAALGALRPVASTLDRSNWNFYDRAGRLVDAVDTAGYVTHYQYDGASRLSTATLRATAVDLAALAAKTTAQLQQMTAVEQNASADDRVSRKLYDNDGLLVGQIDALGYLTEFRYNAAGLLVETIAYNSRQVTANVATDNLATLRPAAQAADLHEYRVYDAQKRLAGTVDGDGYLTELTYDTAGNVAKRISYAGKAATPTAATLALIRASIANSTSADNRTISYTYNSDGQVLTATNVFTVKSVSTTWTTTNTYDLNGKLGSTTHSNGGTTDSAIYDAQGHLLAQYDGNAKPTTYTYNANGLRTSMTDPNGNSSFYYYDDDGRPTYTVDALGNVQQQSYNNFGQVVSTRAYATPVATSGLHGGQGTSELTDLLRATAADQRNVFYYDNAGRLAYTLGADGGITTQTYNAFGQVVTSMRYGAVVAAATVLSASIAGMSSDMLAIIGSSTIANRTARYGYDADGRLLYSIDPQGIVQGKDYDAFGRVGLTVQYATLSSSGRPAASAGDSVQRYAYNERGQVIDYTDAAGNHVVTSYNGFGEVIAQAKRATPGSAVAGALDSVIRTVYDENGAVAATIDPLGAVTTYVYDGDGKVIDQTSYGTPLTAAQLATLDTLLANGAAAATTVADTLAGYLTSVPALDARQQFVYNDSGRLVATYTAKTGQQWSVTTLAYDDNGNVTERWSYASLLSHASPGTAATVALPAASASDARTRLVYDANGRVTDTLTAQTTGAWSLVSQTYDAFGNVLQRTAYAKLLSVALPGAADIKAVKDELNPANAATIYRYDNANRVVLSATAQSVFGKQVRWAVTGYQYDAAGQLRSKTEYNNAQQVDAGSAPSGPPSAFPTLDRTTSYTYDANNRLLSTTDALGGVTLLEYDTRGNVVKRTQKSPYAGEADRVSRVIYDLNNRPVYQIDAAGGVTQHSYDALGNVSATTTYFNPIEAGKLATTGIDKLLSKLPALDRTERYIYDADGQLRYTVDAGGYLQQRAYDALGRLLTTTTYANPVKSTDFPAAADYNLAKAGTVAATLGLARATKMVYDAQGNVSSVTDPEGFVESYTYDALGRKLTYVNQLKATWSYTYDAAGRLLTSKDPAVMLYSNGATATSAGTSVAMTTVLAYDTLGNLVSRTEGQGSATARTTGYEYDLRGRQVRTILPALAVYGANAAPDANGRTETAAATHAIETAYGTLGDAQVSIDIGGSMSFKVYDVLGRVAYDVDATGYVTGYQRNGFGDVIALTRYATQLTIGQEGALLDYHRLPDGVPTSPLDRVVRTSYDQLGRVIFVIEPMATVYDQASHASYQAARTTTTSYDTFGQVYAQLTYGLKAAGGVTPAAATRTYYDARGNKSAQIAVLSDTVDARSGYLTTYTYDAVGNQTGVLEYAAAITGWSDTDFNPGVAGAADHQTTMLYDGNKRKIQEIKVGAQLSAAGAASDIKITYKYDATGNQTVAAIEGGVTTMTYYDALGRSTAIAQLAPAGDPTKMPLSAFRLDAYGNVVVRIDYAAGAPATGLDATGSSYVPITGAIGTAAAVLGVPGANPGDRVTLTSYDIAGHATQVSDANKNISYSSYDVYGRVAKQWRTVSNAAMGLGPQTIYQTNQYDVLGHLVAVETPGNGDLVNAPGGAAGVIRQSYTFNAFGEAETHTTSDGTSSWTEYTDYDNAGRAWRTNVGDGVDKVTLFDAQGNATVLIRSGATDQNRLHTLKTDIAKAEDALAIADLLRTDTRYDLLGRAVDSRQGGEPTLTILVPKDGSWQAVPVAPGNAVNGLLVVGDARDPDGSVTVQYRADANSPWIDQSGTRVWRVGTSMVFNTAGLTGGAYEFRVIAQPTGEAAFERQRGNFTVTSSTSDAQDRLVAQLYVVLMNRAPDLGGLNFYVKGLNNGGSFASVVHGFLGSDEAKQKLPTDATALVRHIYNVFGGGSTADIGAWANRYAAAVTAGGNKEGQVVADLIEALLYQRSPSPALLAAQQRVSAKVTATLAYALTYRGTDPVSAQTVFDQAGTDPAAALATAQTLGTAELRRSQVAQAYLMLFARAPEPGGMRFWLDALGKVSIETAIEGMLTSQEGTDPTLYPPNTNQAAYDLRFVTKIYNNVLGRDPSADELAEAQRWMGAASTPAVRHGHFVQLFVDKIASYTGTEPARLTQKQLFHNKLAIALRFAQMDFVNGPLVLSAEQQGMVAQRIIAAVTADTSTETAVAQALSTVATNAAMANTVADALSAALQRTPLETMQLKIAQLYVALLGRTPDSSGFAFQVDALKRLGGTDAGLVAIATQFLTSEETVSDPQLGAVTSMSALQFVQHIYQLALGQVPTSAGAVKEMNAFAAQLGTLSRGEVAVNIINGMLRFDGLTTDESALKARFNNKVAVGLATAIDLAPFDWADKTQPGIGRLTLSKVTATDTLAALTYAYGQAQAHLREMAAGLTATATAALATQATTAAAALAASDAAAALKLATAQAAAQASAAVRLQVMRIYVGVLGRNAASFSSSPDLGGFNFQVDASGKVSMGVLMQGIIDSDEGRKLYAGLNNDQFVDKIVATILGNSTAATPADLARWRAQLAAPNPLARGQVAFNILSDIQDYGNYTPDAAAVTYLAARQQFFQRVAAAMTVMDGEQQKAANAAAAAVAPVTQADAPLPALLEAQTKTANDQATAAQAATTALNAANGAGDGNAAMRLQVTKLYATLLQRTTAPTLAELYYYVSGVGKSTPAAIAYTFINSDEAKSKGGFPADNPGFIGKLYQLILGRTAGPDEIAYWSVQLNNKTGAPYERGLLAVNILDSYSAYSDSTSGQLTQKIAFDQKINSFMAQEKQEADTAAATALNTYNSLNDASNSAYNTLVQANNTRDSAKTAADQAAALAVDADTVLAQPAWQRTVTTIYMALRGRIDFAGLAFHTRNLAAGAATANSLIDALLSADGYPADKEGFVRALYTNILKRTTPPTAGEVSFWVDAMTNSGVTRATVVNSFITSDEGVQRLTTPVNTQIAADIQTARNRVAARTSTAGTYSAALTAANTASDKYTTAANNLAPAATANTTAAKLAASAAAINTARASVITADQAYVTAAKAREAYVSAKATSDQLHVTYATQLAANAAAQPAASADHAAAALASAYAGSATASVNVAKAYLGEVSAPTLQRQVEQVAQMYVSLFNRAPQLSELLVWSNALSSGMTPVGVADALIKTGDAGNSQSMPAALSNDAFVTQLYKFGLSRDFSADPGGLRFWSDQLGGANPISRAELVVSWLNGINLSGNGDTYRLASNAQAALRAVVAEGAAGGSPDLTRAVALAEANARATAAASTPTAPPPAATLVIAPLMRLYIGLLNRTPDMAGFASWVKSSLLGVSMAQIAQGILTSAEAQQLYAAGLSDRDFLAQVYRNATGRAPLDAELGAVLAQMPGLTRGDAALRLLNGIADGATATLQQSATRAAFNAKVYAAIKTTQFAQKSENGYIPLVSGALDAIGKTKLLDLYADGTVYGVDTQVNAGGKYSSGPDQITLDRWGNVLVQRDARDPNWTVSYSYNDAGQVVNTVRAGGGLTITSSNVYDKQGKVLQATDGELNVNRFEYDANGALLREFHADNSTTTASITYTNDAFGQHLSSQQNVSSSAAGAVVTSYEYDNLGHLLARKSASVTVYWWNPATLTDAGAAGVITDRYTYDELGRRTSVTNSNSSTVADPNKTSVTLTRYDLGGNIVSTTGTGGQVTVSSYDMFNHKTGERVATNELRSWRLDAYGRVVTGIDLGGNITRYQYNANGQLVRQFGADGSEATSAAAGKQDLRYTYEQGSGRLLSIDDAALNQLTTYTYDAAGNRVTEKMWLKLDGYAVQDNVLSYDAAGRLTDIVSGVTGANYKVHYDYDRNGNRLHENTTFTNDAGVANAIDVTYKYDKMNRVSNISGFNKAGVITPHAITYNWMGNRASDNGETYAYDLAGRLSQIKNASGAVIGERHYDGAGRVVSTSDTVDNEIRLNQYDRAGRLLKQRVTAATGTKALKNTVDYAYDDLNNLRSTKVTTPDNKTQTTTYIYDKKTDSYKLTRTEVRNGTDAQFKYSTQQYDANGNVGFVFQYKLDGGLESSSGYISTQDGRVLEKAVGIDLTHSLLVNNELIGSSSNTHETFSSVYDPITSPSVSTAPSVYVVQTSSETLQSVAKAVWGDERLWYLIDEANGGLSEGLKVGQQLLIPPRVSAMLNSYQTFAPYSQADAIGNTTPTLAMPAAHSGGHGGCGIVGKLIMVVVAVAVVYFTAGAAANAIYAAYGGLASTSAAAAGTLGGALATAAGGAIGAAAGSIASQAVGIAIGAQDGFSWSAVAQAGLSGAVTAGIGQMADFGKLGSALQSSEWAATAARAALSNAVTQGISNMTGLQHGFSWSGVAGAFVGSAVATNVASGLARMDVFSDGAANAATLSNSAKFAINTISGIASGVTTSVMRGGKINLAQIATDAFGNALGTSLAETINNYSTQSRIAADQMRSGREDADIEKMAWASSPQQSTGFPTSVDLSNLTTDRVRRGETYLDFDPEARSLSTDSLDSMTASAATSSKSPMSKRSLIASFRDIRDEVLNVDRWLSAKYGDDIFGKGLEQNSIYITTYAEINIANPELGWTGLAPFASNEVRASLNKFALMSFRGPAGGGNDPYASPIPDGKVGLDASSLPGIMFSHVADGNRAVYEDITPYLRFYQQKGINNLLSIAGDIDMPNSMIEAFQTLQKSTQTGDAGERVRLQSVAAKQMLYHEQRDILQPMYDHALLSAGSWANSITGSRLQELNVQIGEKGQPGSFTISPPNTSINVSNFNERWGYASKALETFSTKYYDPVSSSTVRHNIDLMRNPANIFKISPMLPPFFKTGK